MTRFWDAGRQSLGFSVSIKIDFVFVWVVDVGLISVYGIEHDFNSVYGSEFGWCMSGGRKLIGFSIWIEMNLISCDDSNTYGVLTDTRRCVGCVLEDRHCSRRRLVD